MRTITLELLRHGPAHNQLLSPLTPYLALCENHGAVTLHMPFEHSQFMHRLDALGYKLTAIRCSTGTTDVATRTATVTPAHQQTPVHHAGKGRPGGVLGHADPAEDLDRAAGEDAHPAIENVLPQKREHQRLRPVRRRVIR